MVPQFAYGCNQATSISHRIGFNFQNFGGIQFLNKVQTSMNENIVAVKYDHFFFV
jgi:hypothetical protein